MSQLSVRFLICNICGRQFGTKSLSIHQKQCAEKNRVNFKHIPQMPHTVHDFSTFNERALDEFSRNSVATGVKVQCPNCSRSFERSEGLEKHRVLCDQTAGGGVFSKSPRLLPATNIASNTKIQPQQKTKTDDLTKNDIIDKPIVRPNGITATARFCTNCGLDFVDNDSWRFCPQCGIGRSSIQRQ